VAIAPLTRAQVDSVAQIHARGYRDSVLADLGERFLRQFYLAFMDGPQFCVLVAARDGRPVGFVSGTEDIGALYRAFGRRLPLVALRASAAAVRRPQLLRPLARRAPTVGRLLLRASTRNQVEAPSATRRATLVTIAVAPSEKGRGVGTALLRAFEDEMVRRGVRSLKLRVNADNDPATRLYESGGWRAVERAPNADGVMTVSYFRDVPADRPAANPVPHRPSPEASLRERERIERAYERYDTVASERAKRNLENAGTRLIIEERDAELKSRLAKLNWMPLGEARVLDVGCAHGYLLEKLIEWGAAPSRIAGVDLLPDRVEAARSRCPGIRVDLGSAEVLDHADGSFDVVIASTLFSSILDRDVSAAVAAEMLRVLAPGGAIFWFDSRYANPFNPDVRGLGRGEVAALFPGCRLELRTLTLVPPLARRLGPATPALYHALTKVPLLRARLAGVILKPS
jgi:SAM-dependent methyltransferase/ribosomal protein S18 acetylase RimI-like enzyme